MKKIAYYITSHGLGHVTRSIAIIRELQKDTNLEITVCSKLPRDYLEKSLDNRITKFHEARTLFGVYYKDLLHIDLERSLARFLTEVNNRDEFIHNEREFYKKNAIDLIISDISPFPFDVADKLKKHSIAISNFNWYSTYSHIIEESNASNMEEELNLLKNSYEKATLLLRLPFNIGMDVFKKFKDVNLVVRKLTRDRNEIRKFLKLKDEDILIFFGLTDFKFITDELIEKLNNLRKKNEDLCVLFSSFLKPYIPNEEYFRFIPDDDPESQDFLASSDVVIGKVGYSTVSECVAYEKPLIYTTRKDFLEDFALSEGVINYGRGKYYPPEVLLTGKIENLLTETCELKSQSIKQKILTNGASEVARYIDEFL